MWRKASLLPTLRGDVSLASFCSKGFVGIRVPIGTDAFVQNFVAKTCRAIIEDVEKMDAIQEGFIHYQLLRFCQATRLQYINSHILLGNRCVLQQQHVDCKIADALLKKGDENVEAGNVRRRTINMHCAGLAPCMFLFSFRLQVRPAFVIFGKTKKWQPATTFLFH